MLNRRGTERKVLEEKDVCSTYSLLTKFLGYNNKYRSLGSFLVCLAPNKKRLYVALYPSGVLNDAERQYHWAFFVGPKIEKTTEVPGRRYHVKNTVAGGEAVWAYEGLEVCNVRMTTTLLARFVIAKIEDEARLVEILRSIPVIQKDPGWRRRTWLANALEAIARDGRAVGTSVLDWQKIESIARG